MSANRLLLWFIGLALLFGLIWYASWFASNFERVSEEVRSNESPEARKNRFLAAEIFLKQVGYKVKSHGDRDIFALNPGEQDAIFLGGHSRLFLRRNHDQLKRWVEGGGHLIMVPDSGGGGAEQYELLEQLGVERTSIYRDEVDSSDSQGQCSPSNSSEMDIDASELHLPDTVLVKFADDYHQLEAEFPYEHYLVDHSANASLSIGAGGYSNILRYRIGSGFVTTLSHVQPFTNEQIDKRDHAYLLHLMIGASERIWIFYSAAVPPLPKLMWQHAPYILIAALVLFALSLWRMMITVGPRLNVSAGKRRNLLENLEASAAFSWRVDRAQQLFQDNREAVDQAWRRRHPALNSMESVQRSEWLANRSGLETEAVEKALHATPESEQDFIKATFVLQHLSYALDRRGG